MKSGKIRPETAAANKAAEFDANGDLKGDRDISSATGGNASDLLDRTGVQAEVAGTTSELEASYEMQFLKYTHDSGSTADADPGAGVFRFNNTITLATFMYINDTDANGIDFSTIIAGVGEGAILRMTDRQGSQTHSIAYRITGTVTSATGYYKVPIVKLSGGYSSNDMVWTLNISQLGDHADTHVDGTDDIQSATISQKGLMTSTYAGYVEDAFRQLLRIGMTLQFDNASTTDNDPGTYKFRINVAPASVINATRIYLSDTTLDSFDTTVYQDIVREGATIMLMQNSGSDHCFFRVTEDAIDATDYWKIPVEYISGSIVNSAENYDIRVIPSPARPMDIGLACSDETSPIAVDTDVVTFRAPYSMTITGLRASVATAPTGANIIVDVNINGTSIMTTNKLQIDATEKTSTTAATAYALTTTSVTADDEITIDIDQVGSTIAGTGLKVWILGDKA